MSDNKQACELTDAESRRNFLKTGGYLAAGALVGCSFIHPAEAAIFKNGKITSGSRRIAFHNTHTGESFSGVYRVGSKYLPDAFDQINYVLRDFRTEETFPIDPRVIDIIYAVHQESGSSKPFEIISGYRSPKTNAMLRNASTGVAKRSLHMEGRAIDLRLPGFSTRKIRDIGVSLKSGGVGYYPGSDFVHLDTGDVRSW